MRRSVLFLVIIGGYACGNHPIISAEAFRLPINCTELKRVGSRPLYGGGMLMHMRCVGDETGDYFIVRDVNHHFILINQGDTAMYRSSIYSPDRGALTYVYIDSRSGRYTYRVGSGKLIGPAKTPDSTYNLNAPTDEGR